MIRSALRRLSRGSTLSPMDCPCCGEPLNPAKVSDARPGDLWCESCEWLLIREVLALDVNPARCPTHEPHLARNADG
jgi:hypothetical protein